MSAHCWSVSPSPNLSVSIEAWLFLFNRWFVNIHVNNLSGGVRFQATTRRVKTSEQFGAPTIVTKSGYRLVWLLTVSSALRAMSKCTSKGAKYGRKS